MKYFKLFLLATMILHLQALSQKQTITDINGFIEKRPGHTVTLSHAIKKNRPIISRFAHFEVVDCRPDTSRLGIGFANAQRQIYFKGASVQQIIEYYLNNYFTDTASQFTMRMVLKKFWISSIVPNKEYSFFSPNYVPGGSAEYGFAISKTFVKFEAECYVKKGDSFVPFAAIDTTLTSEKTFEYSSGDITVKTLCHFVQKLNQRNVDHIIQTRKAFSSIEVDSISNRDYIYNIFTTDSLKEGIYKTAEDFFNNQPSGLAYEIQKDKDGLSMLYLKDENGKVYYSRNVWGFCDGENCYKMMDGNLFPIFKSGKAFYILGSDQYKVKTNVTPLFILAAPWLFVGAEGVNEKVMRKLRLFVIDHESGDVY